MKEAEGDATGSSDAIDHRDRDHYHHNSQAPHLSSSGSSNGSKVSSSTNGNDRVGGVSVITSPLRRSRSTLEAVEAVRAHLVGNALVAIGTDLAAAAAASGISFSTVGHHPDSNRILLAELANAAARSAHSGANSTHSKNSSSDGSNSASPLSLSMGPITSKPGPKPRAADSPGSGSTTSTTTTTGPGGHRDKIFECPVCKRTFGYKHVLQNHERTHTGEKPFECRECHKRFTRDHHLKTHMRLHTGEKPYHCTHCERQFVQVANLRRHLRVHTGERPYACELCTSRFSDSNQLKAHMLIHKGEKPFECKKCLGRFRRRHHLMHHKCPKDEANIGKPRRGRRPKAYEPLVSVMAKSGSGDEVQSSIGPSATVSSSTAALAAAATSSFYHHMPTPSVPQSSAFSPVGSSPYSGGSVRDMIDLNQPKSRRKPRQTIRILTPQHRDLFLQERDTIQTQPLNLSVSPGIQPPTPLSVIVPRGYAHLHGHSSTDDVLDLSRSRSEVDSEAEAIEEEVEDEDIEDVEYDDESDHYEDEEDDDHHLDISAMRSIRGVTHDNSSDNNGIKRDHDDDNGNDPTDDQNGDHRKNDDHREGILSLTKIKTERF